MASTHPEIVPDPPRPTKKKRESPNPPPFGRICKIAGWTNNPFLSADDVCSPRYFLLKAPTVEFAEHLTDVVIEHTLTPHPYHAHLNCLRVELFSPEERIRIDREIDAVDAGLDVGEHANALRGVVLGVRDLQGVLSKKEWSDGKRCYVCCRLWWGLNESFPFAQVNHVHEDKVADALEKLAKDWYYANPEAVEAYLDRRRRRARHQQILIPDETDELLEEMLGRSPVQVESLDRASTPLAKALWEAIDGLEQWEAEFPEGDSADERKQVLESYTLGMEIEKKEWCCPREKVSRAVTQFPDGAAWLFVDPIKHRMSQFEDRATDPSYNIKEQFLWPLFGTLQRALAVENGCYEMDKRGLLEEEPPAEDGDDVGSLTKKETAGDGDSSLLQSNKNPGGRRRKWDDLVQLADEMKEENPDVSGQDICNKFNSRFSRRPKKATPKILKDARYDRRRPERDQNH